MVQAEAVSQNPVCESRTGYRQQGQERLGARVLDGTSTALLTHNAWTSPPVAGEAGQHQRRLLLLNGRSGG